jgi:hypothetical protein
VELSWRIPEEDESQRYRIGTLQVVVATLFFGAIVVGLAPRAMILPSLTAMLAVAVFLLWRNWRKRGPGRPRPDNVRIDQRGVAWRDESGSEHLLERERIEAFRVAEDADTLRQVPALLLSLSGGFESQPIELHEPATPESVRRVLGSGWQVRELPANEVAAREEAATIRGVEFSAHLEDGVWEFRGSREAQLAVCDRLAEIGEKLPAFPKGARPLAMRVGSTTLQFSPASVAHSEVCETSFHGTRQDLIALAAKLGAALEAEEVSTSVEAPVFEDAPKAWSMRLVVV